MEQKKSGRKDSRSDSATTQIFFYLQWAIKSRIHIYINLSVIFLTLFNDSRLTDSHVAHFCGLQGAVTHGLEDYNCALENLYPSHRKRKKTN